MLIRESQRQPLLIVFEDLHWIDSETQAFLDSLIESLPMARILLLVDYRPEYSHRWGDKTYLHATSRGSAAAEQRGGILAAPFGTQQGSRSAQGTIDPIARRETRFSLRKACGLLWKLEFWSVRRGRTGRA